LLLLITLVKAIHCESHCVGQDEAIDYEIEAHTDNQVVEKAVKLVTLSSIFSMNLGELYLTNFTRRVLFIQNFVKTSLFWLFLEVIVIFLNVLERFFLLYQYYIFTPRLRNTICRCRKGGKRVRVLILGVSIYWKQRLWRFRQIWSIICCTCRWNFMNFRFLGQH